MADFIQKFSEIRLEKTRADIAIWMNSEGPGYEHLADLCVNLSDTLRHILFSFKRLQTDNKLIWNWSRLTTNTVPFTGGSSLKWIITVVVPDSWGFCLSCKCNWSRWFIRFDTTICIRIHHGKVIYIWAGIMSTLCKHLCILSFIFCSPLLFSESRNCG